MIGEPHCCVFENDRDSVFHLSLFSYLYFDYWGVQNSLEFGGTQNRELAAISCIQLFHRPFVDQHFKDRVPRIKLSYDKKCMVICFSYQSSVNLIITPFEVLV